MTKIAPKDRVFLCLQGPHGPFFDQLARALRRSGAQVWRVGFNAGDAAFWFDKASYIPYQGPIDDWPAQFEWIAAEKDVTDLVLYGDARPLHAQAIKQARKLGLRIHVFEEGYLRPYWVTYERGGTNGNSPLMDIPLAQITERSGDSSTDMPLPPGHWGEMRQHIFYGAVYHGLVMLGRRRYRSYDPHRGVTVMAEFRLYLRRLALLPIHSLHRRLATRRINRGGFPYHTVLLQLAHDSAFQSHSGFSSATEFLETVIDGFAKGAPAHHHLVFKAHPLDDNRIPLRREITRMATALGINDRVHYVRGGKLAQLLDNSRTAITANSTAGHQALWRGIPLKVFGRAVYNRPEFTSDLPMAEFFAKAAPPDATAYRDFRRFLLESSQVAGGYYSRSGRRRLLRRIIDKILSDQNPYDLFDTQTDAARQHLSRTG